MQTTARAQS